MGLPNKASKAVKRLDERFGVARRALTTRRSRSLGPRSVITRSPHGVNVGLVDGASEDRVNDGLNEMSMWKSTNLQTASHLNLMPKETCHVNGTSGILP